jgi:hypothetical protein
LEQDPHGADQQLAPFGAMDLSESPKRKLELD